MSSENLHAPRERLTRATLSHHHAIVSLMEELDAVDWYRQRAEDAEDAPLREILLHNMREEIEHACMLLEWLRRNDAEWSKEMDTYLYSEAPITEVEEVAEAGGRDQEVAHSAGAPRAAGGVRRGPTGKFTVGSMKERGD